AQWLVCIELYHFGRGAYYLDRVFSRSHSAHDDWHAVVDGLGQLFRAEAFRKFRSSAGVADCAGSGPSDRDERAALHHALSRAAASKSDHRLGAICRGDPGTVGRRVDRESHRRDEAGFRIDNGTSESCARVTESDYA